MNPVKSPVSHANSFGYMRSFFRIGEGNRRLGTAQLDARRE